MKLVTYTTGVLALLIVATAVVASGFWVVNHKLEAIQGLASSTVSGVGMAVGGCIGSAIVLRFKAARSFIHKVVKEVTR